MRKQTRLLVESLESRRLLASVTIPTNLTGNAGSVVAAPVQIDTASGVRAAEIRITYDTDILNIDSGSIVVGNVWSGNADTQVTANVDDAAGTIVLFVTSANPLSNIAGSLAVLNFTIVNSAPAGDTAALNLTAVRLNEGGLTVSPAPSAGADSTDGLITVNGSSTGNGSIRGFVFADANKNGAVDVGEAIAGVAITLTNSTTGATQQTTSAADGSYSFSNLPAASYQLLEQQPAGFFEGGVNTLTAQLAAGSNLTNQNFVEGGLLPTALFTRLRTTLVMPVGSAAWQNAIASIVQTVAANSSSPGVSSTLATPTASVAAQATSLTAATNSQDVGLQAEGESNAPLIVSGTAAPLADVEARSKQRLAAIEQALLEL